MSTESISTGVDPVATTRADVRRWSEENWDPALPLGDWWKRLAESGWVLKRELRLAGDPNRDG